MRSIFQSFMEGYTGGQALARQRRADSAARTASERYRAGDYAGAEGAFLDQGMIAEAGAIGDLGERNRQRETRETIRGAMAGDGSFSERLGRGRDAALEAGDFDLASQLSGMSAEELQNVTAAARLQAGVMMSLTELPEDPEARRAAALQIVQAHPNLGYTPEQVQQMPAEFFSNQSLTQAATGLMDIESQVQHRYNRERDQVEDERWERSFAADERHRAFERSRGGAGGAAGRRLRLDWERSQEEFTAQRNFIGRLEALRDQATGPGAISFIFTYMKMLDPRSVVRENEYATAANAGGVPEQVRNAYNRALRGDGLSQQIRDEYLQAARAMFATSIEQHRRDHRYWQGVAETEGLDPSTIRRLDIEGEDGGGSRDEAGDDEGNSFPQASAADVGRIWRHPRTGRRYRWTGQGWEELVARSGAGPRM